MALLPPLTQVFEVNASAFLAGVDEMLGGLDRLQASIDETVAATERLSGVDSGASAAEARMAEAMDAVAVAADRQIAAMDELGATMDRNMAAVDANTVAIDEQSGALDANAASSERAGGKAGLLGSAGKTAFLGVAAAVAYSVVKAAEFQSQMTTLLTQAGVAKKQFAGLETGVLALAGQVGFSPTSLGAALYHIESSFASVGIKGPKALELLKTAAEGAAVGHANLVDVTNALDATIASGVGGVKNYSQAMGALNAIVGSGDMTMQDLADAMGTGAMAQAKLFGQSIYQVGAALATFGDNNIRGAKAATDLRMTWQAIQSPMKAGIPVLAQLGLGAKTLADDMTHHGLSFALSDFVTHLKAARVPASEWGQIITEVFGKRAGTGIGVLTDQLGRLQSKLPDLKRGAIGFGEAWKTTQATVGQQFKEFRANLDSLAVSFGSVLLPVVLKVMTGLNQFLRFLQKNPELAAFAGGILAVVGAMKLMAGIEAIGTAVAGAIAMIGAAASATTPEVTAMDAALDANVIGLILIAVLALVAGLYELYRHCKIVRDAVADVAKFFKSAWQDAMTAAGAVVKWFVSGPLAFIKAQLQVFSQFWAQHGKEIEQIAKVVWSLIRDYITTEWRITVDMVKTLLAVLKVIWNVTWVVIRDTVRTTWNLIGQVIHMTLQWITGIIGIALDLITGHWSKAWSDIKTLTGQMLRDLISLIKTWASGLGTLLWDAGKALIQGLIGGIKSMFGAALDAAKSVVSGAVSAAKHFLGIGSPSKVFHEIGTNITLGLATGIIHTIGQAVAASRRLAAEVYAAFNSGQITGAEETGLLGRIDTALQRAELHVKAAKARLVKDLRDWALTIRAGVVDAISDATTAGAVKSAISKLLTIVKDAFNAGDIGYKRATGLTDFLERDNERLQGLAARRAHLLATIAAAEKYAAATTSSIQSWAGLSNLAAVSGAGSTAPTSGTGTSTGTIPGQSMTPGTTASTPSLSGQSMLAGLQQNLATIRQFGSAIQRLGRMGLSKDLLNQIIQMGPVQGLQVAQALIDGPLSVIKSLNTTEAAITKASTGLGQTAADLMYDSGKQAGKGFLSGLQAQQAAIEQLMKKIAQSMVDVIEDALGLPGGGGGGRRRGGRHIHPMIRAGLMAGTAGSPGSGDTHVNVHVSGFFVGSQHELAQELYRLMQAETLRTGRRNPTNMLSLASGRFG